MPSGVPPAHQNQRAFRRWVHSDFTASYPSAASFYSYSVIFTYFPLASCSIDNTDAFSASVFQEVLPRAVEINWSTHPTKKPAPPALQTGAPATLTYTGLVVA